MDIIIDDVEKFKRQMEDQTELLELEEDNRRHGSQDAYYANICTEMQLSVLKITKARNAMFGKIDDMLYSEIQSDKLKGYLQVGLNRELQYQYGKFLQSGIRPTINSILKYIEAFSF